MSSQVTNLSRRICALDEIADPGSRGFSLDDGVFALQGFVVRKAEQVYGYVNRCPHARHPLDWLPHSFLTSDRALILCGSHGARFEMQTGECVSGPCVGQKLTALPIAIENGDIVLTQEPHVLIARYA